MVEAPGATVVEAKAVLPSGPAEEVKVALPAEVEALERITERVAGRRARRVATAVVIGMLAAMGMATCGWGRP